MEVSGVVGGFGCNEGLEEKSWVVGGREGWGCDGGLRGNIGYKIQMGV